MSERERGGGRVEEIKTTIKIKSKLLILFLLKI